MKTQTKIRLLDITDINPQTVSELLEMPEGKKCFRPFYKARASELAEYRADLANKCILMELRLKEKMICVLQSSRRMSSDEVQVSQEYKMLEDEVARNLLAARQIILLIDGYIQKIRTASELKSLEVSDEYPRVEGRVYCEDVSGFEGREYQPILSLEGSRQSHPIRRGKHPGDVPVSCGREMVDFVKDYHQTKSVPKLISVNVRRIIGGDC